MVSTLMSVHEVRLYGAVDRILGGHGRVSEVPPEFSEAEFVVADAFLEPIFEQLMKSLEELTTLTATVENRFTNPALAYILPSQDVVLSAHLQTGGEFLLGDLRIALPYTAIEPYLNTLGTGPGMFKQVPGSMREVPQNTVQPVDLNMSINLGETELTLRDLLTLQVGDVVSLDRRRGQPFVAPVEGVPKFPGQIGTHGLSLAFQIGNVLN